MRTFLLPPFAVLMFVALMCLLHMMLPLMRLIPQPLNWLGLAPLIGGIAIASWHARLFRRMDTNINTFGEPGQLTRAGLFSRTRNPMYLGMLMCLIGLACVLGTFSPLAGPVGFFVLTNACYIRYEERAMAMKFGEQYEAYKRSVPRWL